MTIFFTADGHAGHFNIMKHCNRPYDDVNDMSIDILFKYNEVVGVNDTVYYLGDIGWSSEIVEACLSNMNGKIHYVMGNHDERYEWIIKKYVKSVSRLQTINIDYQYIVLCHYPMRTWDRSHYGSINLHGHCHGNLPSYDNQYDVGVDNNDYKPISYEEICEKMDYYKMSKSIVNGLNGGGINEEI